MSDDIEHLKVHKIVKRDVEGRVGLEVYGQPAKSEMVTEAFGGSADAESEAVDPTALREQIIDALKTIYDPEIPLNVYDLGLIYDVAIEESGNVEVTMTLTAPGCPVAGMIVQEVARRVGEVDGVRTSHVKLTWDPPWTKERMSEEALLELGLL